MVPHDMSWDGIGVQSTATNLCPSDNPADSCKLSPASYKNAASLPVVLKFTALSALVHLCTCPPLAA
ncbi:CIC11C00000005744 [Sungouiella intermedia]|uniref:CIC11C00000005744 n=1 Tax=Sungouiella intermedia TaxID=45354 RepID=A0A1L0B673_9ASCO|nr:CIC11C00000005744 [[Candida] intermedia]